MSQFIDSIKEVKKNYKVYDEWEQHQADDAAKREYLAKTLDLPKDKVELTKEKAKIVVRAAELLDRRSEDNCENMEQTTVLIALVVLFPLIFLQKKLNKTNTLTKFKKYLPLIGILSSGLGIGFMLWGTEKQKEASRVGRFQGKLHELKDLSNFVIYNPEQIEDAKLRAKNIPDKKKEKGISKIFKDRKQNSQDKKEYKKNLEQKSKDMKDIKKILNKEYSPEQITQGEEDKEIIVNIVKDINIKAEEYSENAENVFDTLTVFSTLAGLLIGLGVNKILKVCNKKPLESISIISALIFEMGALFWGTSEQKRASRVGRFVKAQEILKNPKVLMAYSDEKLKQVEYIKSPQQKQRFFEKIGSNFKFFKTYLQNKKEYIKYLKTEGKENEKLYEALKKTNASQKQTRDAKHLQEKTFYAFDKVDEMSQRYSEDTEAAIEIGKKQIGDIWAAICGGLISAIPILAMAGKLPAHKIVKWASNIALDKNSSVKTMIDECYNIISKNKALKADLSKAALFDDEAMKRLMQNKNLKEILTNLKNESKNIEKHSKQGRTAKWFINISKDIYKYFKGYNLSVFYLGELPKNLKEQYKFLKYSNYKTLWNTIIACGLPIMGIGIGVPFAFNSWLTNIQKKAGKIGIMKAMEEIDNPKLFIKSDTNDTQENKKQPKESLPVAA